MVSVAVLCMYAIYPENRGTANFGIGPPRSLIRACSTHSITVSDMFTHSLTLPRRECRFVTQHFTSVLEEEASKMGLCINPDNCKVMVSGTWSGTADIEVQGSAVEVVDEFCYLGSYISQNGNFEKDVKVRIGKASAIFGKMKKVWRNKHINLLTRLRLYEALILSTLLYGAEVWPFTVILSKKLEAEHHRWLRGILGITWRDKATNEEVRKRTGQIRLEKVI